MLIVLLRLHEFVCLMVGDICFLSCSVLVLGYCWCFWCVFLDFCLLVGLDLLVVMFT